MPKGFNYGGSHLADTVKSTRNLAWHLGRGTTVFQTLNQSAGESCHVTENNSANLGVYKIDNKHY